MANHRLIMSEAAYWAVIRATVDNCTGPRSTALVLEVQLELDAVLDDLAVLDARR